MSISSCRRGRLSRRSCMSAIAWGSSGPSAQLTGRSDSTTRTAHGPSTRVSIGLWTMGIMSGLCSCPVEARLMWRGDALEQDVGERTKGCGALHRRPEGPLQNPQTPHPVSRKRGHQQRLLRMLHPPQHAARP